MNGDPYSSRVKSKSTYMLCIYKVQGKKKNGAVRCLVTRGQKTAMRQERKEGRGTLSIDFAAGCVVRYGTTRHDTTRHDTTRHDTQFLLPLSLLFSLARSLGFFSLISEKKKKKRYTRTKLTNSLGVKYVYRYIYTGIHI